jgi:hypothetical protein
VVGGGLRLIEVELVVAARLGMIEDGTLGVLEHRSCLVEEQLTWKHGRRGEEVRGGERRWEEVRGGARRCEEVRGGERRWEEVRGGERRWGGGGEEMKMNSGESMGEEVRGGEVETEMRWHGC